MSSPQRRSRFKRVSKEIYKDILTAVGTLLCALMPIRDVRTRWNFTHAMIKRALLLKEVSHRIFSSGPQLTQTHQTQAINRWIFDTPTLQHLLLTSSEWQLLEQLCSVLEVRSQLELLAPLPKHLHSQISHRFSPKSPSNSQLHNHLACPGLSRCSKQCANISILRQTTRGCA